MKKGTKKLADLKPKKIQKVKGGTGHAKPMVQLTTESTPALLTQQPN